MSWLPQYRQMFNKDLEKAKFKIGDLVLFEHPHLEEPIKGIVQAVNDTGEGIEYLVAGAPFLAWESQLSYYRK